MQKKLIIDVKQMKIPEDIIDGGIKIGLSKEKLEKELQSIIDTDPQIKTMQRQDFKIRYAWAKVLNNEIESRYT